MGERLSQTKDNTDGTTEDSFYGYDPHSSMEALTDSSGDTKATYGYTAYGQNDDQSFTGVDKPDPANPTKEPYNFYRYTAKRFDPASGTYDLGFRDYDPGLNRFLTRDLYNGALADLDLATDPFTNNRYSFASGNPTTMVDLTGHAPTQDNPVSANPALNVQLNSPNSTWSAKDRFVGCACKGLAEEVEAANKAQRHRNPLQALGNVAAGVGRGIVGFVEGATPQGQANLTLNNPVAAMVTQRIPVVRDVANWVADHQASGAYDQAAKTLGANPSSGAYKGGEIGGFIAAAAVTAGIGAAGATRAAADEGASLIDDAARTPVGRRGSPMNVPRGTNEPAVINGRSYSGHALDEMQSEGFVPSIVEEAISSGQSSLGASGRIAYYSPSNNVTVIAQNGRVITVTSGTVKIR